MKNPVTVALWFAAAALATFFGVQAAPAFPDHVWIIPALVVIWIVTLAGQFVPAARRVISAPLRALRGRALTYWLIVLVYLCVAIGMWVVPWQPTNGRAITTVELCYLAVALWGFLWLLFFDASREQAKAMGQRIGSSKLSGVLITLTTVIILFWGIEAYLRIFYITTDAFGFTAMNYHWYANFGWGQDNSLGFRDDEPLPDAEGLTRVAIVGDSFAMGHGINNIEDTFPQLLEDTLGAGYDVNLIARSGWDTDVELYNLTQYPYDPDIVILSYYLNDIDYLLTAPEANPDNHFVFPSNPVLSWFVLNFFGPNYAYYNLLQFTSPTRNSNHLQDLIDAHTNDEYWSRQAQLLYEITLWTQQNNKRLIVLLWPHIVGIEMSQPAVQQVANFFAEQGVEVVDMSDALRQRAGDPALLVNNFDPHPGILAQRLAAGGLALAIQQPPAGE